MLPPTVFVPSALCVLVQSIVRHVYTISTVKPHVLNEPCADAVLPAEVRAPLFSVTSLFDRFRRLLFMLFYQHGQLLFQHTKLFLIFLLTRLRLWVLGVEVNVGNQIIVIVEGFHDATNPV